MKGLMLTLVLLSWTGMVVAQQTNSSPFGATNGTSSSESRFGGAKKPDPDVVPIEGADDSRNGFNQPTSIQNQNDRVKNSFALRQRPSSMLSPQGGQSEPNGTFRPTVARESLVASNQHSTKKFTFDPDALRQLTQSGNLTSKEFDSRGHERIQISDQAGAKAATVKAITPRLVNETLVFQLSTDQLNNIDQYKFEYDVPAYLRGRYRQVAFEYPEAQRQIATNESVRSFPPASTDNNGVPRWNLPNAKDPNHNIMLPDDRFGVNNRPLQNRNRQTDIQNAAYRTEIERQQREKWEREQAENERLRLAQENRALEQKVNYLNRQNQVDAQRFSELQRRLQQGNYADKSFLAGATQPVVPPNYQNALPQRQPSANTGVSPQVQVEMMRLLEEKNEREVQMARLEAKNQLLENRLSLASYENRDPNQTRDLFNNGIVERKPAATDVIPLPGVNVPSGDRPLLSAGDLSKNNLEAGTAGFNSQVEKPPRDGTELVMFILLVGSIGLNLYLWFVARSFHSRYEELANELRETFTATV